MKTAKESIPFFKNYTPVSQCSIFKRLENIKGGKTAQAMLTRCEAGMPPAEFEKLRKTKKFKRAIDALAQLDDSPNSKCHISELENTATVFHRLKKLDGTIPWEEYSKSYPCLAHQEMDPAECRTHALPCHSVLTKYFGSVLETILCRHDILSRDGGIFAERLITAIELGVPFRRIKRSMDINLPAAMNVLKESFPDCSEEWLEKLAERYASDWERAPEPPAGGSQGPGRAQASQDARSCSPDHPNDKSIVQNPRSR